MIVCYKKLGIKSCLVKNHLLYPLIERDFADETIQNLDDLLHSLEMPVKSAFYCNEGKTEFISSSENALLPTSLHGVNIKSVKDFKYLGSYINSSESHFKIRKGLAWKKLIS